MRLALALMLAMVAVTIVGSSEEPMKVVQASEVLAKIKAGEPVEYDHVTIEGNLSLDQLGLPIKHTDRTWEEINWVGFSENETIVNSSITINNSTIEDAVAFDNIILYGMVINFENTEFLGKASFKGSHFYSSANFRGAKFKSDVNFRGTQFYNFTNFSRSQFNNSAVFWVSHFNSTADFNNSKFNSTANFRGSQFNSYAGFHSKFNGDADFSSSTFNSTAHFRYSQFNGTTGFRNSQFNSIADFSSSQFNSTFRSQIIGPHIYIAPMPGSFYPITEFQNSQFNSFADFDSTKFNCNADFSSSQFNNFTVFEFSQFNGRADFSSSQFNDTISFGASKFNSGADFYSTKFNGTAYFVDLQFNGGADFSGSHFKSYAQFYSMFNMDADFSSSKFNNLTVFQSQFNSTANFRRSQFNSYAGFHSKFNGDADFSSSTFNSTADFRESLFIKNVYFTGSYLKNLNLTSTDYEKMYIRWGNIDSLVYDDKFGDTTYQLLMQNFRNLGFLPDADSCYYQFRKEQCLHRDLFKDPFMLLLDLGGWIFYGYGKKPLYPLGWSVGSILVFGAFWYIVDSSDHKNTIDEYSFVWDRTFDKNHHETSRGGRIYSVLKQFVFSATIFLSGTRLFVDPPEIPTSPKWSRSFIKGMFTLERVLGAFFSILLFLAIGGTVVR